MTEDQRIQFQAHIDELAKNLKCEVRQSPNLPGMMYVEFGYVEGPTLVEEKDYFINLHELGHVAYGHTQGRPPKGNEKFYFENGVLKSEAQAWDWALDKAIIKPSLDTRKFMWDYCLGSYYMDYIFRIGRPQRLGNGNRHHVEFVYDHPDEYFTSVVKKIQADGEYKTKYIGRYV